MRELTDYILLYTCFILTSFHLLVVQFTIAHFFYLLSKLYICYDTVISMSITLEFMACNYFIH